jgi:hypothetical protein
MVPNPPLDSPGDPDGRALALITGLLRELQSAATLELARFPLDHYQVTIALPGEIGKTLIVSASLVHGAATNPAARQALRAYLRSELLRQRSQQALAHASEARAAVWTTRLCPVCERPIRPGQRIIVRRAEVRHAFCGLPGMTGAHDPPRRAARRGSGAEGPW